MNGCLTILNRYQIGDGSSIEKCREWLDYFGYEDSEFAELMGVTRQSIWRYRHEPNRLNPAIMVRIGEILGIHPEQLWHLPPQRPLPQRKPKNG